VQFESIDEYTKADRHILRLGKSQRDTGGTESEFGQFADHR
jgi:hypothetical protein